MHQQMPWVHVNFGDADAVGGGLAPEEEHAPQEEPHTQVQREHAQDGQLYSIEDGIASEKQPTLARETRVTRYNLVITSLQRVSRYNLVITKPSL